jgi:uncharacterized membrane protein
MTGVCQRMINVVCLSFQLKYDVILTGITVCIVPEFLAIFSIDKRIDKVLRTF